jgi:hypothetical protein
MRLNHLILRSERSERLEGWPQERVLVSTLRDGRFAASSG